MKYRRAFLLGGTFFFTVVTCNRQKILANEPNILLLREVFRYVLDRHPFQMDALVVLADHIHAIWTLPEDDSDYSTRWRLIKSYFSRNLPNKANTGPSVSRINKSEQSIWQRRFWEHLIRDEQDLQRHVEYINYNPVKHGLVQASVDWPYSSFHQFVSRGLYPAEWGAAVNAQDVLKMDLE